MPRLETVLTDSDCPLLSLNPDYVIDAARTADTSKLDGISAREFAIQQLQEGIPDTQVMGAILRRYELDSRIIVALVDCATRQTITRTCPFAIPEDSDHERS